MLELGLTYQLMFSYVSFCLWLWLWLGHAHVYPRAHAYFLHIYPKIYL